MALVNDNFSFSAWAQSRIDAHGLLVFNANDMDFRTPRRLAARRSQIRRAAPTTTTLSPRVEGLPIDSCQKRQASHRTTNMGVSSVFSFHVPVAIRQASYSFKRSSKSISAHERVDPRTNPSSRISPPLYPPHTWQSVIGIPTFGTLPERVSLEHGDFMPKRAEK